MAKQASGRDAQIEREIDEVVLQGGVSANVARFSDLIARRLDRGESVTLPYSTEHAGVRELVRRGYRVMRSGLQGSPGLPFTILKR